MLRTITERNEWENGSRPRYDGPGVQAGWEQWLRTSVVYNADIRVGAAPKLSENANDLTLSHLGFMLLHASNAACGLQVRMLLDSNGSHRPYKIFGQTGLGSSFSTA